MRHPSTISRWFRYFSTVNFPVHYFSKSQLLYQCNRRVVELFKMGGCNEARKLFDEMSQRDSVTWNSMISGYAQNGLLHEAENLFDSFPGKNVRTRTIMLTAYAKHGLVSKARKQFDEMSERNVVSWNAMISCYVQNGDLVNARMLFSEMPDKDKNAASWNALITGYCKYYRISEARTLFDKMPDKNSVSWGLLMSGYVKVGDFVTAVILFIKVLRSEIRPNQMIFVAALSAIIGLSKVYLIESFRTLTMKLGYEEDVIVGTGILNVYTKNGWLDDAKEFFEMMPERNEYCWTTMIAAYSQCGRLSEAVKLYEGIPKPRSVSLQAAMVSAYAQDGRIFEARHVFDGIQNPDVLAWNAMVAGYAQNGMVEEATVFFSKMPMRNSVSWAAMIAGFVQNGRGREALGVFAELHKSGTTPSPSSFTSGLVACANIGDIEAGRQIHCITIKLCCQHNSYVGNGLISMYAKCRRLEDVTQAFEARRVMDTVCQDSHVTGLSENYTLGDAHSIFERMPTRDTVSWNVLISAYMQSGEQEMGLQLFLEMLCDGTKPNELTIASLLSACGSVGASNLGQQIHSLSCKLGLDCCLLVGNALITLYFRCGFEDGFLAFEEMAEHDVVSYNAVLDGCTLNGLGKEAIETFEKMISVGILPDQVSFLGLLSACSRAGLMSEGWAYFNSMKEDYGIVPIVHHYTCIVDLLGRAGLLSEAESVIVNMPVEPDIAIWEVLLSACCFHCNINFSKIVAERLLQTGTQSSQTYIVLSNIYAFQGMLEEVREVKKLLIDQGLSKEPEISWIQVKDNVNSFLTADDRHHHVEEIYSLLEELYGQFQTEGLYSRQNCSSLCE